MYNLIFFLFALLRSWLQSCLRLRAEIVALRQQVIVLRRSHRGRVRLRATDRVFWVRLSRLWSGRRSTLAIVKPETVISWHRKGFRLYWAWKSRGGTPGRSAMSEEVRDLMRDEYSGSPDSTAIALAKFLLGAPDWIYQAGVPGPRRHPE